MTGLYLFAAATGVPLVVWFLVSGGDEGGGAGNGVAGVMLRRLPLSTFAFVAATFGICGLVLGAAGTGDGATFLGAAAAGGIAGVLNSALFAYLRRSESSTETTDEQLAGRIGRVVLPLDGRRRGRIVVTVGGQQIHLSAQTLPNAPTAFEIGAEVVVVDVREGIARVTGLGPEFN